MIRHHDRDRQPLAPAGDSAGGKRFERASADRRRSSGGVQRERRAFARARSDRCGASAGKARRAARDRPQSARPPVSGCRTPAPAYGPAPGRARPVRGVRRAVGAAGFGRLRQRHQQGGLRPGSGGAAPCRNRPASPRAPLRGCRHRARCAGRASGSPAWTAAVPAPAPAGSGAACPCHAPVPPSSSNRATCIVSVEPPDTTRPFHAACPAARAIARGSTPEWR